MPPASNSMENARRVFSEHGGILRTSEAIRYGVHPRVLYELRDRGDLERVGRGIYRLSTEEPLTSPDLVAVAMQAPRAVVCLISALAYHELTTQVPHAVDLALPSHAQKPKIQEPPIRVFWFPESSFSAGIEVVEIDKVPVRIYSVEKTLADCFKYRNKIGLDVAVEALRLYRQTRRKPDIQAITKYGQIDRVFRVMRPYLEALV